ncbi:S8 family peptidase [Streptomyces sp. NBC_00859]|uniref:S8 family peptidase n=1 Tax=Streptomyces sp. NBC_00859 TaxID=2903682 RepID=UPI00386E7EAA|nr:S8 family serine peptidase [Streptomyces sp. NBC_00859]
MDRLASRPWRALALPAGLALVASLGLLPGPAAAEPAGGPAPASGPGMSYVVNTGTGHRAVASAERAVSRAGGTVVIAYDEVGVIVAHSSAPDFARTVRRAPGVDSAGATRTEPLPARPPVDSGTPLKLTAQQQKALAAKAAPGEDPMEPLQWDMRAIRADQAHKVTLGSRDVTVAVIDTGVDDTHPDIAPNFDRRASADCTTGRPDTKDGAWRPAAGDSPHGTHVAGEIAGARNGTGITGVAPGVRVAGIKVGTTAGFFYTEAVVCGFIWAADHGAGVTNNSYFTDPWYFNCTDDPDQRALVDSVTRASRYAERKGAVNVAAAANEGYDLASHSVTDPLSPDDGTAAPRTVDPSKCPDIPAQLPGVVTVSATGSRTLKSSYSNYGLGVVDIAAPGGDSAAYQPPEAPATSSAVLGPVPGGGYAYMAGTSMASPHVAGVVALIESRHPHASPALVKALLYAEADRLACPKPYPVDADGDGRPDAVCEGGRAHNGFYGAGLADALHAVTR